MEETFHIYLVSDSTGETVTSVARSSLAHFENIKFEEHLWTMVRTKGQLERLASALQKQKGIVMFTIVNIELQKHLRDICSKLQLLAIPVLEDVVNSLSTYLGVKTINQPGRQHMMNEEYFSRMNAINFALAHDDGQANFDVKDADIILVGPSRTSKSPTSIYLAYRGFKTANIPFVLGQKFPEIKEDVLVVGLLLNPERLVEIRKNRLLNVKEFRSSDYVEYEKVKEEIIEAKKLYQLRNWPMIDVTRKSVEETAANIIKLYQQRKIEE